MAIRVKKDIKRSFFDLTHQRTFSMKMGDLIPFLVMEVLPGDSFKIKTDALIRFTPLVAPVFHEVNVKMHYFFVPNRLVWGTSSITGWQDFITKGLIGTSTAVFPTVTIPGGGYAIKTLADYLGVPTGSGAGTTISALNFRGYTLIWNEWYRNANIITPATVSVADGADTTTNITILKALWEKDYFSSCYLSAQQGTGVTLPLGTTAPVIGLGTISRNFGGVNAVVYETGKGGTSTTYPFYTSNNDANLYMKGSAATGANPEIYADLSNAAAATITSIRQASSLQRWLEKAMKSTTRYVSQIEEFFGVRSSDQRLDRPELIGAAKAPIITSEIQQTSATGLTGGTTPAGNLTGHGISGVGGQNIDWSSEEHGFIYGLMYIAPRSVYQQGLPKYFFRTTATEFAFPEFALIGEQAVTQKEIYHASGTPDANFGFQNRYAEYKQIRNSNHGIFRTTYSYWTFTRVFGSTPTLDATFLQMGAVSTDPFAVPSEDTCLVQLVNHIDAVRTLPTIDAEYKLL